MSAEPDSEIPERGGFAHSLQRFREWFYAFTHGFFWLPCPLCGESFGGHEPHGSLMTAWYEGKGVCQNCSKRAEELNRENMRRWEPEINAYYSRATASTDPQPTGEPKP